jgi:hypothetical protein
MNVETEEGRTTKRLEERRHSEWGKGKRESVEGDMNVETEEERTTKRREERRHSEWGKGKRESVEET